MFAAMRGEDLQRPIEVIYSLYTHALSQAIEAGDAPDILGSETPYQHGYATFVVRGAQNIIGTTSSTDQDHAATLKYLLDLGAPPNMPDIVGYTALHHACNSNPRPELARILLEGGADPNQQDHFGSVPLMGAFQNDAVQLVDLLMEHGASLDIKDGDGDTPDDFFIKAGPYITAAVQKWKRRRAGERQPLDEKACSMCAKTDVELKFCAKCGSIRYCSKECQSTYAATHVPSCMHHSLAAAHPHCIPQKQTGQGINWTALVSTPRLQLRSSLTMKTSAGCCPPPTSSARSLATRCPSSPSGTCGRCTFRTSAPGRRRS